MSPEEARRQAVQILTEDRFHRHQPPRPFHGVLRWIGDRLGPVTRLAARIADSRFLLVIVAIAVVGAAFVLASVVIHRRSTAVIGGQGRARRGNHAEDPAALERRADQADRDGDLELALRLRFRAGLLRLDAAGVLDYRPSMTTGAVVRAIPSADLAGLARTLDEVVYGRRPVSAADVAESRERWPLVLSQEVHG